MSLQTRLAAFITAVGADIKDLKTKTTLLASASIDPWHVVGNVGEPAFQNGWLQYDGVRLARFKKFPDGRVRLSGLIKSGTNGQTAFTLPVGYRPSQEGYYSVISNAVPAGVIIGADGLVTPFAGNNAYYFLDGIEFDTGQASVAPIIQASVTQEGWHSVGDAGEPAFANSWVNYGSTFNVAAFKKTPDGRVRLKGLIKNGTLGLAVFTLPAGYRPANDSIFPSLGNGGVGEVRVNPAGVVSVQAGNTAYITLDNIEFDLGQTTFPAGKSVIPTVTALPAGPTDGDEIYFQTAAMKVNGVKWHCQYDASAPGAYKWIVLGGSPISVVDAPDRTVTPAGAFQDTASVLQLTVPLAGDYFFTSDMHAHPVASSYLVVALFTAANVMLTGQYGGFAETDQHNLIQVLGLAAGVVKARYFSSSGTTATAGQRMLTAMPVRVG